MTLRATATQPGPGDRPRRRRQGRRGRRALAAARHVYGDTEIIRGEPEPGERIEGPAVVELREATLAVPPGWSGEVLASGTIRIETVSLDPVTLRVASGALRAACEEMGAVLIRASHSANIKERRDASLRAVQPRRRPRHAGRAHPRAPRRDARRGRGGRSSEDHEPGVSWVLNDPYSGGTHLPDITVDHARVRRRRADRLRRQPRPSRRRRRPDAGLDARRLARRSTRRAS